MKIENLKLKKTLLFISVILMYNCSDPCKDSDLVQNFPVKFKLTSSDGENQLLNSNFDESLLKILNPASSSSFGFVFPIEELNGELFIESHQIVNTATIVFEYDGTSRFEVVLSDKQTETIDCVVETLSFTAKSSDGSLLCDCGINDFVNIEFDI